MTVLKNNLIKLGLSPDAVDIICNNQEKIVQELTSYDGNNVFGLIYDRDVIKVLAEQNGFHDITDNEVSNVRSYLIKKQDPMYGQSYGEIIGAITRTIGSRKCQPIH